MMEDNMVRMKIQLDFNVVGIGNVVVTTFEEDYPERYVDDEGAARIAGRIYEQFAERAERLNLSESMLTKKQFIITRKEEF